MVMTLAYQAMRGRARRLWWSLAIDLVLGAFNAAKFAYNEVRDEDFQVRIIKDQIFQFSKVTF
jgi:hypothetical protein